MWSNLISTVVGEVFGDAEMDEGNMNPIRLNSANRTRWLCDRTMRSDKRMDTIEAKVDTNQTKVDAIEAKVDAMKADMQANQAAIMEQLRSMASH